MRESRSYGSVGERGGNEPLYPEGQTGDTFNKSNQLKPSQNKKRLICTWLYHNN